LHPAAAVRYDQRAKPVGGGAVFERFTDRARHILVLALDEATRFNHGYVGTEHLLLALIKEGEGVAASTLQGLGITLEAARLQLENIIGPDTAQSPDPVPFTPRVKNVLELSLREASELGHRYIGTEHLLLALVREGEGVGCQILVRLGCGLGQIRARARVLALLSPEGEKAKSAPAESPSSDASQSAGDMLALFTDRARRVVFLAQEEARTLHHDSIGTEHILLGLVRDREGLAARVLRLLDVSLEPVRQQVTEITGQGQQAPSGHLPFSPKAKEVLELSLRAAREFDHDYIGTEHLLLGLLREKDSTAAQVIVKLAGESGRATDDAGVLAELGAARQALTDAIPPDATGIAEPLDVLGMVLSVLADGTGDRFVRCLEVEACRATLAATPADAQVWPRRALFLGWTVRDLADSNGSLSLMSEAMETLCVAVAAMPTDHRSREAALRQLSRGLGWLASHTGRPKLMAEAATRVRAAVTATAADTQERAASLAMLGESLGTQYEQDSDPRLFGELVAVFREAIRATSPGDQARAARMADLARYLRLRHRTTDEVGLLAEAIALGRELAAGTGIRPGKQAGYRSALARDLVVMYEHRKEPGLITEAVGQAAAAVAILPDDDPEGAEVLDLCGMALAFKWQHTDDTGGALEQAVQWQRAAVARAAGPERAVRQGHLADSLYGLGLATAAPAVLAEAIAADRSALEGLPPGHPDRANCLNTLGLSLLALFQQTGDAEALTEAVSASRAALGSIAPDEPDRARYLANLADVLHAWYQRGDDLAVLDEAIEVARAAVAAAPVRYPGRVRFLRLLGAGLMSRSERTGDEPALEESIRTLRSALASARAGHPGHVDCLLALASALRLKAGRTAGTRQLDEAIKLGRAACAAAGDYAEVALCLGQLGECLRERFERTGEVSCLVEAAEAGRRALTACPVDDPSRALLTSYLAGSLRLLFMQTRDLDVLRQAIDYARQAVAATPADHPAMAIYQNTLNGCLQFLYVRTGEESALVAAVEASRAAVAAMVEGRPERQDCLNNLGLALRALAEHTRDAELMREAVQAGRSALSDVDPGHPDRPARLNNLAASLRSLAMLTGEASHAVEATSVLRKATASWPAGHPHRATGLMNLGRSLMAESAVSGSEVGLDEAERCLAEVGGDRSAPGVIRLWSWSRASLLASRREGGAGDALAAAEAAATLLPQLAPGAMALSDRFYWPGELSMLAAQAAAAAVAAGRPERAVELLEQTRGVAIADLLDARGGDEARLSAKAPALADELADMRSRLAKLGDASSGQRQVEPVRERLDAQAAWDDLAARIRAVDGFASFGATPPARELTRLAGRGPVVLVYAADSRGDALILTGDPASPVRFVPLPGLTEATAGARAEALLAACRLDDSQASMTERRAAQASVLDVLAWLWDTVAGPVLRASGYDAGPGQDEDWPRVWWCPIGVMGGLPLHCAGHHADLASSDPERLGNPRTVLDRVVSAYATTLRGLGQARDRQAYQAARASRAFRALRRGRGRLLVIAVPEVDGAEALPGATNEAEIISALVRESSVLSAPGRSEVVQALPGYEIVHFACHVRLNPADPATGYFVLPDHEHAPLTVADIGALDLPGQLAFLSACDTAVATSHFTNETVHLTGAFHLAGYQRVIGTLWPVADEPAVELCERFYQRLTRNGTESPAPDRAAGALHEAVRELRRRYPDAPTLWAAHTYTGA